MRSLWSREVASALLITGLGVAVLAYAQTHYTFGSFRSPGPGLFPSLVAGVLALVGAGLIVQTLLRKVEPETMAFAARPFGLVLASIAAFALIYPVAGVGPAVFVLAIVSAFADRKLNLLNKVWVGLAVTAIAVVLFRLILGVQLPVIRGVW